MTLRRLFVPYAIWLVVNLLPIYGGERPAYLMMLQATFRSPLNLIFPLTYGLAIISFVFAFCKLPGIRLPERVLLAGSFPFAFAAFFETFYQELGHAIYPNDFGPMLVFRALEISWLILGFASVTYWRFTRVSLVLFGATLLSFAVWTTDYSHGGLQPVWSLGFSMNLACKLLSALFFLSLFKGTSRGSSIGRDCRDFLGEEKTLIPDSGSFPSLIIFLGIKGTGI